MYVLSTLPLPRDHTADPDPGGHYVVSAGRPAILCSARSWSPASHHCSVTAPITIYKERPLHALTQLQKSLSCNKRLNLPVVILFPLDFLSYRCHLSKSCFSAICRSGKVASALQPSPPILTPSPSPYYP